VVSSTKKRSKSSALGQNARLAAKLTGWKIDIKPESGFFGEEEK